MQFRIALRRACRVKPVLSSSLWITLAQGSEDRFRKEGAIFGVSGYAKILLSSFTLFKSWMA
jgi:hypothetical protein